MQSILSAQNPERRRLFAILRERSFRTGDFVLASGKRSNYYLDCRTTSLHAEGATLIGSLFYQMIVKLEAELNKPIAAAGGMTLGADPLAAAVSVTSFLRGSPKMAYIVRKEEKDHGAKGLVVGIENIQPGADVVLLEDVVTTGGSTLKAYERVKEAGLNPVAVFAIVDRLEGGRDALEKLGLRFYPLFTKDEFLK